MSQTEKQALNILETGEVGKLLWKYALPAIVSSMVVALYNIVDRVFIGQVMGPLAISGLALTFPLMVLLQAFGTLVGVGAGTRISIVLGMKDQLWAEKILAHALLMLLCISGSILIFCIIFLDPILVMFGASEQTMPYAKEYLQYLLPGSIFSSLTFSHAGMMRSSGYPAKSMHVILLGAILNVFLDALFILVLDLGIRGAALATVISMAVSAVYAVSHFFRPSSTLRYHRRSFHFEKRIVRNILAIGMAPFLVNAAGSAIQLELNQLLLKYGGDIAIGVAGIIGSYGMMVVMVVFGFCQGMQPIVGYNYGAGRIKRVKDTFILTVKAATVVTCFGFVMAMCFPRLMAGVFTTDEEMIIMATRAIRITFAAFTIVGFQVVTGQFFQSIGKVHNAIFLSLSRQVLFLAPALYLCSLAWGLTGVWVALPVSDLLSAIVAALLLWREKRVLYG